MFPRSRFVQCNLNRLLSQRHHSKWSRSRKSEERDSYGDFEGTRTSHGPDFLLDKSKGQHILTNPRVLDSIVRKADVRPTDTVLEIGPGTGNLTLKLLEVAHKVVAVEIDERMVGVLQRRVAERGFEDRLTVIQKDALKTRFPQFDIVVANIPFQISSPLVVRLVFGKNRFRNATLLLQKEFCRRLLANPGDAEYNRLAVNVKLVADVGFVMDVSKRDFLPVPKVDSSVITIRPKDEVPGVNLAEWRAFTRTCFSNKNKTLGATFKQKRKVMEIFKTSTLAGLKKQVIVNDIGSCSASEEEDDVDYEGHSEEECLSPSMPEGEVKMFKEKIVGVLRSEGFADKRPSKLSNKELLHLLALLNRAGIYFHDHAKKQENASCAVS